jgi:acetyl-CoA carboxylase biotin carboxylase subunit
VFRKVLIANRGEIAARIARSCRSLGCRSVVVYSEADRDAPWLALADQTLCIGPARAEESYLNAGAILQAAEQTESQAIHPGYGFLAENERFAARCEQQGISFVGPGAAAIRRMGNKVEARRTMAGLGLPVIPGSADVLQDVAEARALAAEIGYPILLKARGGGGGKGMRRCDRDVELPRAFTEAALEAGKAFGDPALYLERYIAGGRHVEFQVLCDRFGAAVHLGERECSIQRQHQKLLEESPSPVVDDALREELGQRVARAVVGLGYRNAGTVEFLRAPDGRLYFMEMNTRLQVEHPVTEMRTGIDLVAEQLRIAANEPLRLRQEQVRFTGHAVEFRINAEDPANGFRPDPGRIRRLELPPSEWGGNVAVRWDGSLCEGYRVPAHYDSLLGKLIVHGPQRERVLEAARSVLGQLRIEGVKTTVPLHQRLLEDEPFRKGSYDVSYLSRSGLLGEA